MPRDMSSLPRSVFCHISGAFKCTSDRCPWWGPVLLLLTRMLGPTGNGSCSPATSPLLLNRMGRQRLSSCSRLLFWKWVTREILPCIKDEPVKWYEPNNTHYHDSKQQAIRRDQNPRIKGNTVTCMAVTCIDEAALYPARHQLIHSSTTSKASRICDQFGWRPSEQSSTNAIRLEML